MKAEVAEMMMHATAKYGYDEASRFASQFPNFNEFLAVMPAVDLTLSLAENTHFVLAEDGKFYRLQR